MGMGTILLLLPAIRIRVRIALRSRRVEEPPDYFVHDVLHQCERVILLYLKISGCTMVTGALQGGARLGILWILYDDFTSVL